MSIAILKAGVNDSIQDKGRQGYAAFGINPSGCMDPLAMQAANALAGNQLTDPVIEMHFPAPVLQFRQASLMAISGADFGAVIQTGEGETIPFKKNKTAILSAGSKLSFTRKMEGQRCYLSVHGGFKLPTWFGSYSTNVKVMQGGYKGRRLQTGDELPVNKSLNQAESLTSLLPWFANVEDWYNAPSIFNVIPGPEWDWLEPESRKHFLYDQFTISLHSDRMGVTLEALPLNTGEGLQLLSGGVSFGTIQLLPNGQLIILAAEHPTTGGYPRIANIISAHLPKLAQAAPGTKLKFLETTMENAEDLLVLQQKELKQIQLAVKFNLTGII